MPYAPKAPCLQPGCGELVSKGRCSKHRTQHQRAYESNRKKTRNFYDSVEWRHMREFVKRDEKICRMCKAEGFTVAGVEVDHIIPRVKRPDLQLERSNLQLLCVPHHSQKTRLEQ